MGKFIFNMVFALLGYVFCYGQLNSYKYIIVPAKFQDFKKENQFRTSTLVKYLFTNEGFNTVYGNNLPEELEKNPCLGVAVELDDTSNLFNIKTRLSLRDCSGKLVMTSQEGKTKTKEFEQAYREAISEAFGTFRGLEYNYVPDEETDSSKPVTISFKNDIMSTDSGSKSKKEDQEMVVTSLDTVKEDLDVISKENLPAVMEKGVLYALPIEGGYQLVDDSPKVVYKLKSTSAPDVFIVSREDKNGVIFKNEGKWFIEMNDKGGKTKELNIKF